VAELTALHWAGIGGGGLAALWAAWRLLAGASGQPAPDDDEEPTTPDNPEALAAEAGVPLEQYALARVIASEAGGQSRLAQLAVGWAVVNEANRRPTSVARLLLGSATSFGKQGSGGRGYASTARAPVRSQITLAGQILAGSVGDPTGGATNFDSPREQDREFGLGLVRRTAQQVAEDRYAQGFELVTIAGLTDDFRFWRKA